MDLTSSRSLLSSILASFLAEVSKRSPNFFLLSFAVLTRKQYCMMMIFCTFLIVLQLFVFYRHRYFYLIQMRFVFIFTCTKRACCWHDEAEERRTLASRPDVRKHAFGMSTRPFIYCLRSCSWVRSKRYAFSSKTNRKALTGFWLCIWCIIIIMCLSILALMILYKILNLTCTFTAPVLL